MVNIFYLKREITSVLGAQSNTYFSLIKSFLSGKVDRDYVVMEVARLFPQDKTKHHERFVAYLQGHAIDPDPKLTEKYKEVKRRNEIMKRRFDGSKVVYEWVPPTENQLAQHVLVGTWAEGLDGMQTDVTHLLETALNTYLK